MEDSKDEKNLLAGLNLHYVDAMALNDDENKVDQSLIFFFLFRSRYQHFAGQNDQLRLKSSKAALKAFQMIFPWLKMK